jgi:hypothetical protein
LLFQIQQFFIFIFALMKTKFIPWLHNSLKTNCFPSNLLYYGNSDAIADDSNIESTGPQSTTYIFLSSLGLKNELWEESR